MESKAGKLVESQSASGSNIIQIHGDFSITQILQSAQAACNEGAPESDQTKLSPEERAQLAIWTEEVVQAESGLVHSKIVRASLNAHLGVKNVGEMTAEMFNRATIFLQGWKSCALGRDLSPEATIAQILRMWTIVPGLRGTILEFTKFAFQREMLKSMTTWELRATLAYSMTRWQAYWEQRNA